MHEIIHGTMRTIDLTLAFLEFIEQYDPDTHAALAIEIPEEALDDDDHEWWDSEDASYLLNEDIWDAMSDLAPPYCYFGAHEGDSSSFGFWIDEDYTKMEIRDQELISAEAGEWDDADYPDDHRPLIEVNDHGNMTLYLWNEKLQRRVERWSVV